jgi:hypothetical protein
MKNFYYLSVALMAAMFFVSCSSNEDNDGTGGNGDKGDNVRTDVVDYTVMFYSCGGANLDTDTESNWAGALNALAVDDPNVRYMVQFKYSGAANLKKYNPTCVWGGKAAQCYRFELTRNKYNYQEQHFDLSGYEYGNQGADCQIYQPDSLANFIKYCQKVAPAKNYILLLSDHGGAYSVSADFDKSLVPTRGAMQDDTQNDLLMSNKEIRTAIEKAGVHLKALVFDCCIMNNMESITEFLDLTDYYYGSGHSTVSTDHKVLVEQLKAAAKDGDFVKAMKTWAESSAKIHYDTYKQNKNMVNAKYVDFVMSDMSKVKNIYAPLKNFVDYVEKNWSNANQQSVKTAAENTYHYFNESALYDVKDYCLHLAEAFLKEGEVVADNEAFKLVNAFDDAVKAAQCFHIYTKPDENKDYELSYSVTLAAQFNENNQAIHVRSYDPEKGKYFDMYNVDNGDQFVYWAGENDYDKNYSFNKPYQTFANTYYKTAFDQKVQWSRLFKLNPYFPQNNPPTDDEGDHLRGSSLIHL